MLGVFQADIGPVLAAVGGFVNAVADRNAIAHPGFAGANPDDFRVRRIDGDRADRLHRLAVENRLEGRAAIHRLPYAAAGRADKDRHPSILFIASSAATRPLMVAEPMLRAGNPEIVAESNFTGC